MGADAPQRRRAQLVGGGEDLLQRERLPRRNRPAAAVVDEVVEATIARTPAQAARLAIVLLDGDGHTVAGADVVQQKIAEGMDGLAAERVVDDEAASVERRAGGGGGERLGVALAAADGAEQLQPARRIGEVD